MICQEDKPTLNERLKQYASLCELQRAELLIEAVGEDKFRCSECEECLDKFELSCQLMEEIEDRICSDCCYRRYKC